MSIKAGIKTFIATLLVVVMLWQPVSAIYKGDVTSVGEQWWSEQDSAKSIPTINYNDLTDQGKVLWAFYDTVNVRDGGHPDGDWETRVEMTAPSASASRFEFSIDSKNRELHLGIFNIKDLRIVFVKQVETAPADLEYYEGRILETYLIGYNCNVFESDDLFTFDGINFDEVLLESIDGEWYILENRSVSTETLEELENELLTSSAITHNESERMTASTHDPLAERSELIDLILPEDRTDFVNNSIESDQNGIQVMAAAPPMYDKDTYDAPTDIYVLVGSSVNIVNFETYLKRSLQKEMGYSYSSIKSYVSGITEAQYIAAMQACAMSIKMYAWFCRSLYTKHKSEGAHLCNTTHCQVYSTDTPPSHVVSAVDGICGRGIRTDTGWILYSHYLAGSWTSAGTKSGGRLMQQGAFYLAKAQNYISYIDIMRYYFANVPTNISAPYPAYPNTVSRKDIVQARGRH